MIWRPTIDDIELAASRIADLVLTTPTILSDALAEISGFKRVHLKCENLQRSGSFKIRGAYANVTSRPVTDLGAGLVTASSGNHAVGLAAVASHLELRSVSVMPHDAPRAKVKAAQEYGSEVLRYSRNRDARDEIVAQVSADRGFTPIHAYDDGWAIAGQGTVGLELWDQTDGDVDVVFVPCSGGSLTAGVAIALKTYSPSTKIFAVEPAAADDTRRSLAAGRRVRVSNPTSIADGLLIPEPGEATFPILQDLLDGVIVVTEDEIRSSLALACRRLGLVVEPSSAVAIAALMKTSPSRRGETAAVVLTGRNVDASLLCDVLRNQRRNQ